MGNPPGSQSKRWRGATADRCARTVDEAIRVKPKGWFDPSRIYVLAIPATLGFWITLILSGVLYFKELWLWVLLGKIISTVWMMPFFAGWWYVRYLSRCQRLNRIPDSKGLTKHGLILSPFYLLLFWSFLANPWSATGIVFVFGYLFAVTPNLLVLGGVWVIALALGGVTLVWDNLSK